MGFPIRRRRLGGRVLDNVTKTDSDRPARTDLAEERDPEDLVEECPEGVHALCGAVNSVAAELYATGLGKLLSLRLAERSTPALLPSLAKMLLSLWRPPTSVPTLVSGNSESSSMRSRLASFGFVNLTRLKEDQLRVFEAGAAQLQHGGTFIVEQNGSEFDWSAEISGHFRGCLHILKDKDPAADGSQDHMRYVVDQERRPGAGDGSIGASAITFPSHVPRHVQSSLARLHQNLGHPSLGDLSRHLKYARAEASILKAAKSMRCQVCDRNKRTHAPRPAASPTFLDFNALVSVGVFSIFDAERKRHSLMCVKGGGVVQRLTGHRKPTSKPLSRPGAILLVLQ